MLNGARHRFSCDHCKKYFDGKDEMKRYIGLNMCKLSNGGNVLRNDELKTRVV